MCDGLLVTLPGGGHICLPLYHVRKDPIPTGPDPGPIERLIEDISRLASINQALAHVRDQDVRVQLGHAVHASLKTVGQQLPKGLALGDGLLKMPGGG